MTDTTSMTFGLVSKPKKKFYTTEYLVTKFPYKRSPFGWGTIPASGIDEVRKEVVNHSLKGRNEIEIYDSNKNLLGLVYQDYGRALWKADGKVYTISYKTGSISPTKRWN